MRRAPFSSPPHGPTLAQLADRQDLGDERGLEAMAQKLPWDSMDDAAWAEALSKVFEATILWNDGLPAWRRALLHKFQTRGRPHAHAFYCEFHRHPVRVRMEFHAPPGKFRRLYLAGNWDRNGDLADLAGWNYVELRPNDGGPWSAEVLLQKTAFNHLTHAVVRTAPWPRGETVGNAVFRVGPEKKQVVRLTPATPRLPRPRRPSPAERPATPLVVLLVDGGSWHSLLPLAHRDRLPNFSKLLQEGAATRLISVGGKIDFSSVPCIRTAVTGRLPDPAEGAKAGLGFSTLGGPPRLWELLSARGKTAATVGLRGTFPVDHGRGPRVSEAYFFTRGLKDPEAERLFFHPKITQFSASLGLVVRDLVRLKKLAGWVSCCFDSVSPAGLEAELDRRLTRHPLARNATLTDFARQVFDLPISETAGILLDETRPDALFAYFTGVDAASHAGWLGFEPAVLSGTVFDGFPLLRREFDGLRPRWENDFYRAHQDFDDFLGDLMARAETVVVFSDHGMAAVPIQDRFFSSSHFDPDKTLDLYAQRRRAPAPSGLRFAANPEGVRFFLPAEDRAWLEGFRGFLETVAYRSDQTPIFSLSAVADANTGREAAFTLAFREPVLSQRVEEPWDSSLGPLSLWSFFELSIVAADHAPNGVFLARGPSVRPGVRAAGDAHLTDVAPTILALAGLPALDTMQGRVLDEILVASRIGPMPGRSRDFSRPWPFFTFLRSLRWAEAWKKLIVERF